MVNQFSRTQLLLGKEGMERLFHARVAVFGTELRKRGVKSLKVVYSKEKALTPIDDMTISCRTHCICPPARPASAPSAARCPAATPMSPLWPGLSAPVRLSTILR